MIGLMISLELLRRLTVTMSEYKTAIKNKITEWRTNIELFASDNFNFIADDWQLEAFRRIEKKEIKRLSIKSGQGVGKTAFSAIVFLWFLTCYPNSRVVATAPTRQQLNDVLWAELEKWRQLSPFLKRLLEWTKTYISVVGREKRWFGVARASSKPENMQGFHEDNMLFIIDEASGVSDEVLEAVRGTLSGVNNKLLLVGNPTKTSGMFYESHTSERASWSTMTVDSSLSKRTDKENIQSLINKYGAESNVVRVRVHGLFPLAEDDVFIPISLIEQSINSEPIMSKTGVPVIIDIGCDVARFGDDKTIIGCRVDGTIHIKHKIRGQDTMQTADSIVKLYDLLLLKYKTFKRQICIKIDDSGVGGGVTDRLRQLKRLNPDRFKQMRIIPVIFGLKIDNIYYDDTTTYMMSVLKALLSDKDEQGNKCPCEINLPDDNDLVAQLSVRKYFMTDKGKLKVESKKDMKKRGLPSPDEADCILLCCLPVNKREEMR